MAREEGIGQAPVDAALPPRLTAMRESAGVVGADGGGADEGAWAWQGGRTRRRMSRANMPLGWTAFVLGRVGVGGGDAAAWSVGVGGRRGGDGREGGRASARGRVGARLDLSLLPLLLPPWPLPATSARLAEAAAACGEASKPLGSGLRGTRAGRCRTTWPGRGRWRETVGGMWWLWLGLWLWLWWWGGGGWWWQRMVVSRGWCAGLPLTWRHAGQSGLARA